MAATNTIKTHDFVELDYTGTLEDGTVFDTTLEEVAKKNEIEIKSKRENFKPIVVCVGEHQLVPGLDESMAGRELGKTYTVIIPPEKGFGKKDAKFIRLVPLRTFAAQNIMPQPGLRVNIDNHIATILRVSGGRVMVDFNHPLASKTLKYTFTVKRILTDTAEKLRRYLGMIFPGDFDVSITNEKTADEKTANEKTTNKKAIITTGIKVPDEIAEKLKEKLTEVTGIRSIEFAEKKPQKDAEKEANSAEKKANSNSQDATENAVQEKFSNKNDANPKKSKKAVQQSLP